MRLLAVVATVLAVAGCTSVPEGASERASAMRTPTALTNGKGPPSFVRVDLDPTVTALPARVFAGHTRSVPTRLKCVGSLDETWMFIRWRQGVTSLKEAAPLLQPTGKSVVGVALQRSDSQAVILKLDTNDELLSRTTMTLHKGRWWPGRGLTCADG